MSEPAFVVRARRPRRVGVAAAETARQVLGQLEHGTELMCFTHGQFSMVDALTAILDKTGPARVDLATWSAARADLEHAERFLRDGRIAAIRFLVDRSFETRQPAYCRSLVELFGAEAIRTTRLHAKFAVVVNDEWAVGVRSSMNLNENTRLEYLEVSEDRELAGFFTGLVDQIFETVPAGQMNNYTMPDTGGEWAAATRSGRDEVLAALKTRRPGREARVSRPGSVA